MHDVNKKKNMINSHILDGVALTKFLYWIKNCKINNITERYVENKLETFTGNSQFNFHKKDVN